MQGSAHPVLGGDEPLTPTSQVYNHSICFAAYTWVMTVREVSLHVVPACTCSWDHQAIIMAVKMAHLTHPIWKLWLDTKATSRSADIAHL